MRSIDLIRLTGATVGAAVCLAGVAAATPAGLAKGPSRAGKIKQISDFVWVNGRLAHGTKGLFAGNVVRTRGRGQARLEIKPAGRAVGEPCLDGSCDSPKLSVLIDADEIWVGVSRVNDFQKIPRTAAGYDWAKLEATLKEQKASAFFTDKSDIEIAADSSSDHPIAYQTLIATMDIAVKTGFADVGLTDPHGLSARPTL